MPSTKKTVEDPYFDSEPTTLGELATSLSIGQLSDDMQTLPVIAGWGEMVSVLKEHWAKQMLGEETTDQALMEIEKSWNLILAGQ